VSHISEITGSEEYRVYTILDRVVSEPDRHGNCDGKMLSQENIVQTLM